VPLMQLPTVDDPSIRLIEAVIRFANGAHPRNAFGPIVEHNHRAIRAKRLGGFLDVAASQKGKRPDFDPLNKERLDLRTQLAAIAGLMQIANKGDGALKDIQFYSLKRLGQHGPRGLMISGLVTVNDELERFSLPLWIDFYNCYLDGMALILSDYRGVYSRIFVCPHGAPLAFQQHDSKTRRGQDEPYLNMARSASMHFFADLRFVKGTPMKYCSARHQRADYMRKYRQRISK
jgi:hypothetical protein